MYPRVPKRKQESNLLPSELDLTDDTLAPLLYVQWTMSSDLQEILRESKDGDAQSGRVDQVQTATPSEATSGNRSLRRRFTAGLWSSRRNTQRTSGKDPIQVLFVKGHATCWPLALVKSMQCCKNPLLHNCTGLCICDALAPWSRYFVHCWQI
eukprot:5868654-Amphidinium_carterae.1